MTTVEDFNNNSKRLMFFSNTRSLSTSEADSFTRNVYDKLIIQSQNISQNDLMLPKTYVKIATKLQINSFLFLRGV